MKNLLLKLLRDIKKSKGQFIAISLVIAIGIFFYTGLSTLSNSLDVYTKNYYAKYNLSDLNVYYSEMQSDDTNQFNDIEGINKIEGRYTFEGKSADSTLKIHTIPRDNEINTSYIVEGNMPQSLDEIVLDSRYALDNDYQVRDTISINYNEESYQFRISGFIENVEHLYNIKDPMLVIPNHKTYGVGYIPEARLMNLIGKIAYNELLIDIKEGYDEKTIGKKIEKASGDLPYLYQLTKDQTISYSYLNTSITNNKMMSKVLPVVFFIVSAGTIFLTMSRVVDSERNQIGVMKALGIKNKNIIGHYMGYPFLASMVGGFVGSISGFLLFKQIGSTQLKQMYSLPNFHFIINVYSVLPAVIISLGFGLIATYLSCRKVLKENAAQAMRQKPPKKMRKILIERCRPLWKRLSYGNKIIVRNIFLNKQKALFTSIGVIICIFLLIIAFGYQSSMDYVGYTQFNKVHTYDLRIDYHATVDTNTFPDEVSEYYSLKEFPVELITNEEKKDTKIIVTEKENDLLNQYDEKGKHIELSDGGVIISEAYADYYNLKVDDSIKIRFISPELEGKTINVHISDISVQYTGQAIYTTPNYIESFSIDYLPTTLLIETSDVNNTYQYFNHLNNVNKITEKSDLKRSIDNSLAQSQPVIILFVLCAIVLSSAAIYTISSINIHERSRELATLKVLGYEKKKINRLIFNENMLITIFSILIATPFGVIVYKSFTNSLKTLNQQIPSIISFNTFVASILITLVVTIIVNFMLRRKTAKVNMIESLKSVE